MPIRQHTAHSYSQVSNSARPKKQLSYNTHTQKAIRKMNAGNSRLQCSRCDANQRISMHTRTHAHMIHDHAQQNQSTQQPIRYRLRDDQSRLRKCHRLTFLQCLQAINWSARQASPTSITYMHEKNKLVVLRQRLVFSCASKARIVDTQGIGRNAIGSHDVHLTGNNNHGFMTKIIQHAPVFRCNMTNMIRSHRPHSKPVHGKPMLWKKSSKEQLYLFSLHAACISALNVAT